ncbi:MAG: 23S rRNA (adenine(2503)-C(2))-methyltransferase RlmN, partial [Oscillospiraceae bacterium]
MMTEIDLKSMTTAELEQFLCQMGEPKFRAKQIFQWLHQKQVTSFDEMKNIPAGLRQKLVGTSIVT